MCPGCHTAREGEWRGRTEGVADGGVVPEAGQRRQAQEAQRPIDGRHIDLPFHLLASVHHLQAGPDRACLAPSTSCIQACQVTAL